MAISFNDGAEGTNNRNVGRDSVADYGDPITGGGTSGSDGGGYAISNSAARSDAEVQVAVAPAAAVAAVAAAGYACGATCTTGVVVVVATGATLLSGGLE